jgi:hypothetical protein
MNLRVDAPDGKGIPRTRALRRRACSRKTGRSAPIRARIAPSIVHLISSSSQKEDVVMTRTPFTDRVPGSSLASALSLIILLAAGGACLAGAPVLLATDPVHVGDTYNTAWIPCAPPAPLGPCWEDQLLVAEGGGCLFDLSIENDRTMTGEVFIDGELVGVLAAFIPGDHCDNFPTDVFTGLELSPGYHVLRICSVWTEFAHGWEYDDFAFRNIGFSSDCVVAAEAASWGALKSRYR